MDTKQKIFEKALDAFAARGYKRTTVRDICRRADVNVAAINYHFGGKAELYAEVFAYLFSATQYGLGENFRPAVGAEEAERFLQVFLRQLVPLRQDNRVRSLKRRIMLHELFDPSENFTELMEKYIRPDVKVVAGWLKLCRPDLNEAELMLKFFALLAEGIFYFEHENFVASLAGADYVEKNIDAIVAQIMEHALRQSR
ncbi:MAG: CerR family C-terminal domain-containing protein [Victivallales bacterium]|nr:CerR family C-terminal domain-containing protein [Victivallales bacterium]